MRTLTQTGLTNGQTYWYRLSDENGEEIESIGGFIGDEALSEAISEELKATSCMRL